MLRRLRVFLCCALCTAALSRVSAQTTTTAAPVVEAAAQAESPRAAESAKVPFPCFAKVTNRPREFSGFWTPKPNNQDKEWVSILIGFSDPDPKFPFDCVGEPLQITVPNGQVVDLARQNWTPSCTPTLSVTPAVADSLIAEALSLIVKVGPFAAVRGGLTHYELPPLKNKVLNISVVCNIPAAGGLPARKLTQTATITYQNPPRVAVSAGLLAATDGVKSYTILTTKTGVNSSGTSTSQTSIGISGDSSAQVIPFGFINLYLAGSRKLNLSSQFGIGVNPNLSSAKIEYFLAPLAFAWHDFYIAPGIHFGQHEMLTGGFSVGDIVTGMSKPPIGWRYEKGLAFSLSYNLKPLAKAAAPSGNKGGS